MPSRAETGEPKEQFTPESCLVSNDDGAVVTKQSHPLFGWVLCEGLLSEGSSITAGG